MAWKKEDNKNYTGKIDRIYVSMTEDWEVEYFIDKYLKDHNYGLTDKNRDNVLGVMEKFPGKAPIKRDDMIKHLNDTYAKVKS